MATVTYHHQPGIHKTRGTVPLAGTSHIYTVSKILWPETVTAWIRSRLLGVSLHVCCGLSPLGTFRLDLFAQADVCADAARLPFQDNSMDTVLCDPPYNGKFQWNHDLLDELARVARRRIVFQHWYSPIDKLGYFRKDHQFRLVEMAAWLPKSYFGRGQLITVMDREESNEIKETPGRRRKEPVSKPASPASRNTRDDRQRMPDVPEVLRGSRPRKSGGGG